MKQPSPNEYCGVVEEIGKEVKNIKPGQFVVGSFATSDNTCVICRDGYKCSCVHREFMSAGSLRHCCNCRVTNMKQISSWTEEELSKIAETDDLYIAPFRDDGETYGTLTWIWSVVVDHALYVRAYNGQSSRWYQAALRQKAGRITAAGLTKEVIFEPVDGAVNNQIDDAYRAKYKSSPYLKPMIGDRARSATVKVTPREAK